MWQAVWERRYLSYRDGPLANEPSLFATQVMSYLPPRGRILDLGAGNGKDTRFFAEQGYDVISTDFSDSALKLNAARVPQELRGRLKVQKLDMRLGFPFPEASFDVAYAHLSLHYFDKPTTSSILGEVARVLTEGAVFAFLVNSTSDPEYGAGPRIEEDFFLISEEDGEMSKRYFSVESTRQFVMGFDTMLLDNLGEVHFKSARGIHNLIRFVGTKGHGVRTQDLTI